MANTRSFATLMAGMLAVGLTGVAIAPGQAWAQAAATGVSFADPASALTRDQRGIDARVITDQAPRFSQLTPAPDQATGEEPRQLELEVSAPGAMTGIPLDVSIAQRASFGADANGDLNRRGRGSEVRVGHALGDPSRNADPREHRVYMYAASDDQALTWAPGAAGGNRVALQDRVEVGDHAAGVTYERYGVQASLAYVEREVSTTVGRQSFSKNENFAGVTLTMRH